MAVYIGAPTRARLLDTWRDTNHLDNQATNNITWRRVPRVYDYDPTLTKHGSLQATVTRQNSREYTESDLTTKCIQGSGNVSDLTLTQLPRFNFDMQKVYDLEDLPIPTNVAGQTHTKNTYSMLATLFHMSGPILVTSRKGQKLHLTKLLVGDATVANFEVACWGAIADAVLLAKTGDIILLSDFGLSLYGGKLCANSRRGRSQFSILFRTHRENQYDDRYRPILQEDLQSKRVSDLRHWTMRYLPDNKRLFHAPPESQ